MGRQARQILRVEGQVILKAQDKVSEQHPDQAEHEHGNGVGDPALLALGVEPAQAVGQPFEGAHYRVEPGVAAGVEHLHEVEPERFGDQQQGGDIHRQLQPGVGIVHGDRARIFPGTAPPPPGR